MISLFVHRIKKRGFKLFNRLIKLKIFRYFFSSISFLPIINEKSRNVILTSIEEQERRRVLKSFPYRVSLNVSNLCNLRCKFCEIHYFYWKAKELSGKVYPNELTIKFIKEFKELFDKITTIELTGATGEPFLNKHFLEISNYLTNGLGVFCTATTNGTLITKEIAKKLVKINFGSLLFSIHGANKKVYKDLQGDDLNKILNTIKIIQIHKEKYGSDYPIIGVNFLICRENVAGIFDFLDKLKELKIDFLNINHYYDSRNRLPKKISFYFDKERGNQVIKEIYGYANKINLKLLPSKPPFLNIEEKQTAGKTNFQHICRDCSAPFNTIKFKGCVEYENSNYISVCNRVLLFRLNYKEFFNTGGKFRDIWNHELLQYFRETVGKNPICKFCKHPETPEIRCVDNIEYSKRRDNAVRDFFKDFNKKYPSYRNINGLYILIKNPYEYIENEEF